MLALVVSLEAPSTYKVYYLASPSIGMKFFLSLTPTAFAASALLAVPFTLAALE